MRGPTSGVRADAPGQPRRTKPRRPRPRRGPTGPAGSTSAPSSATCFRRPVRRGERGPPGGRIHRPRRRRLADIFKEFKKGVDKQLGKEDYDTRYNLGIAYKEMGLVDEAIAEFQLAAKDEARLLECSSMLGICFMEKGMPKLAVKWFEKGLKAPGRTPRGVSRAPLRSRKGPRQSDEFDEGLTYFEDVYGQDTTFRDVAERIERLREKIQQRDVRH